MFACFPRVDFNLLVWVACLPLLAVLVSERNLARAFRLGYLSGVIFLAGSCYWFVEVMEGFGKLTPALAMGVLLLFVAVFGVFFGLFALGEAWVARQSLAEALVLSPFLWVSTELARTYLMTGFPWNLLGYAVQASGIRQLASVTGVYGLSFLAVATSALLAWMFLEPHRGSLRITLGCWIALLVAGNFGFTPSALPPGSYSVLLVQPNVPLDEAALEFWAPWRDPAPLRRLVAMTLTTIKPPGDASSAPPLVIWAENPAPFYFDRDPVFRAAAEEMARQSHAYVVLNTVTFAGQDNAQPKNSAILLGPEGREVFQYDKIRLVPFGEYVPGWAFPSKVGKITSEVGNFIPGTRYQVAETAEGKIGISICYEAIFPQLLRRLVAAGAQVLVNISNDAWYGDSSAAFQHLEMARLRAIENRRFLLRATNDGITAIIDPYGRVVDQIPRHRALALAGHFDYLKRLTFYTRYGDVFAWVCVAVAAGMVAARVAERRKQ